MSSTLLVGGRLSSHQLRNHRMPRKEIKSDYSGSQVNSPKDLAGKRGNGDATIHRKRSRSQTTKESPIKTRSPAEWTSPRRCSGNCDGSNLNGHNIGSNGLLTCSPKSPRKRLSDQFSQKRKWDPRDSAQMQAVKEVLHVATAPKNVVCREGEQNRILEFCKSCIEQEKAGSLYVCGCPGTGKTLSIDKVKEILLSWSKEEGFQLPDMLSINCASLTDTSQIFSKVLEKLNPCLKMHTGCSPLKHLQKLFSQRRELLPMKMMLIVADEMDYLITRDRAVLHDLFMLTTFPLSRFILIGVANAIDLADRFLPRLEALNCKPSVITFHAYTKDQILKIIQQRLMVLGYDVFEPIALEFCARCLNVNQKVAAASGDMRRALDVCRRAIEVLETELRDVQRKDEVQIVRFDHVDIALSKAFKNAVVDTIQSLPQHQQIILCSAVKLLRQCKKNTTTLDELNNSYLEICRAEQIPAVGLLEFADMCGALSDQGLLKLGKSKQDKQKRVTLLIDGSDVIFALKGIRFFHSCLQD